MSIIKAGIGFENLESSFEAGKSAAAKALKDIPQKEGGLVLAFCTNKHDYQAVFEGIRSEAKDIPIIGGSSIGVITNDDLGYDGHQVGVAVLPNDVIYDIATAGELDKGEKKAGLDLGKKLSGKRNPKEKLALLFYDSVKKPPPPAPVLNVSSYLLDGFERGLGDNPPLIVGAGLVGDYVFGKTKQFCGTKIEEQNAIAALCSGDFVAHTTIMHGCRPMGDYHTITKIEGSLLYEIDGKPAIDVIDELLGNKDWQKRLPLLLVTLGVNHGDKFAPYDEKNYVNRLIVGIVPEKKAIVLFEADFENGTEFQFMRRNAEMMHESAEKGSQKTLDYLHKNQLDPFFALYIDCAGRTAGFSGAQKEEASVIQKNIGKEVPLLGFYSGVEIAPFLGKSRGLDWTGRVIDIKPKKITMDKEDKIKGSGKEREYLSTQLETTTRELARLDMLNLVLTRERKQSAAAFNFIKIIQQKVEEAFTVDDLYLRIVKTIVSDLRMDSSALLKVNFESKNISILASAGLSEDAGSLKPDKNEVLTPTFVNTKSLLQPFHKSVQNSFKFPYFAWYPILEEEKSALVLFVGNMAEDLTVRQPFSEASLETFGAIASVIALRRDNIIKTQELLKKREEKIDFLAEILKTSHLSVIASDVDGKMVYVNPATEELYGYRAKELIGKDPGMCNAEPDAAGIQKEIMETVCAGKIWKGEILNRKKNGDLFYVEVSVYRLLDKEGNFIALVGFQEDITDRKQAEEKLKEKMKELEEFHDLAVGREIKMIELEKELKKLKEGGKL